MQTKQSVINSGRWAAGAAIGVISVLLSMSQSVSAQPNSSRDFVAPTVFQAAGPTAASIQGTLDAYRAALGGLVNGNNPGPLTSGRREINWDGGNPAIMATTDPVTPFDTFLNTRGSRFTTPGKGLSQATPSGLATLFNNPTYTNIFTAFSPSRLFTPVGSNVTEGLFFIPGTSGGMPATVTGFGAIFSDVDQPDGSENGRHPGGDASTLIEYFDKNGREIFSSNVPSSPGDGNFSFLGIVFNDAKIARVRITTGDERPGRNDDRNHDIVMMDDFIYGEPQVIH
ncbi:MAG TPA: hypothetical protein VGM62_19850 [Chthoniobacterales bacterium]|jgi:hypothetical protein